MALKINETEFRRMSQSPTGPVGLHLSKTGVKIEALAKALATDEKLVRTGRYRAAFNWRLLSASGGLLLKVGNAVPYARLLERGTPPHQILPRHPKDALWWTHGAERGWFVPETPLSSVNHPGTRAYGILRRAALAVVRSRFSTV